MKKRLVAAFALLSAVSLFAVWSFIPQTRNPPSFPAVKEKFAASDAVLYDRHGHPLQTLRNNFQYRRLEWAGLDRLPPSLIAAVIGREDKRFYRHGGVDWIALAWASVSNPFQTSKRGASTITMQLASILDPSLRPATTRRTVRQKLEQARYALALESRWTKNQVLEAYLNLASFRGELQGISTASHGLFHKRPEGLDAAESVVLAALLASPNAGFGQLAGKACNAAKRLDHPVTCGEAERAAGNATRSGYVIESEFNLAPFIARRLLVDGKRSAHTTLDVNIQQFAIATLRGALAEIREQNVNDGAVLVVENKTGDVLAYVANAGRESSAYYVDGILARRQAGSTLKPFLYGTLLERKLLTAASYLDDSPVNAPTPRGIYRPANYDNTFHGLVTLRTALASSLNVPAVRAAALVGPDAFIETLSLAGLEDLNEGEYYGLASALGSVDVDLWSLTGAYRVLANGGVWSRMRYSRGGGAGKTRRVFSTGTAFIVSDILSDREARSETFGLENALATRYWSAVKTGTSKDMRDNWCVGYSTKYTVGVWVGNYSGQPMRDVSGVSGAAPIWREIMDFIHQGAPPDSPSPPKRLVRKSVRFADSGMVRDEWFIAGTEQEVINPSMLPEEMRIEYPVPGTLMALDPDIPEGLQRVFFDVTGDMAGHSFRLDGKTIGYSVQTGWSPERGNHDLALVDESGKILDTVTFSVR